MGSVDSDRWLKVGACCSGGWFRRCRFGTGLLCFFRVERKN